MVYWIGALDTHLDHNIILTDGQSYTNQKLKKWIYLVVEIQGRDTFPEKKSLWAIFSTTYETNDYQWE